MDITRYLKHFLTKQYQIWPSKFLLWFLKKYKKDALSFHPDKNPDSDHILSLDAKSKWDRIHQAYFTLGDTNEYGHH